VRVAVTNVSLRDWVIVFGGRFYRRSWRPRRIPGAIDESTRDVKSYV